MAAHHVPAQWIWLPQEGYTQDAYAVFRRVLTLPPLANPRLRISASSSFQVSCNGGSATTVSQPPNLPGRMCYQWVNLRRLWKSGKENLLEFRVHVLGRQSLTTAILPPGLWVELWNGQTRWDATDATWQCAPCPAYESGNGIHLSGQLGNAFIYHQTTATPRWENAREQSGLATPEVLHDPQLYEASLLPDVHVVQAGFLFRPEPPAGAPAPTAAEQMSTDFLQSRVVDETFLTPGVEDHRQTLRFAQPIPFLLTEENQSSYCFSWPQRPPEANGWYLIVDLGEERTGWLTLTLQAEKGTILDVGHGEHLRDGRVRAAIGGRNYADRIHCSGKPLTFTHRLRRLGARYLELHATHASRPPKIGYLGIRPVQRFLPLEPLLVDCSDSLLRRLDETGLRTLVCCQHEHFEDCPMREQGLYAYDARNQALYGYPVWGNYKFVSDCYQLLAEHWNEGAQTIQMCSPGDLHLSIPIFGLVFVAASWELYLHSGDPALVMPLLPTIDRILAAAIQRIRPTAPESEICLATPGNHPEIWNFCEWQPGLDGRENTPGEWQAPYNLYLIEALRAAALLSRHLRMPLVNAGTPAQLEQQAQRLAESVDRFFLSEERILYRTSEKENTPFHEHIQFLAIYNDVIPWYDRGHVLKALETARQEGSILPSTTSTLPYWLMGSLKLPISWREKIFPRLLQVFTPSLFQDSSTLWETELGGEDFTFAGSLCHGWSSLPSWYLRAVALGITPASPGYRTFHFKPQLPKSIHYLASTIKTPYGDIQAECRRNSLGKVEKTILACPPEIRPL